MRKRVYESRMSCGFCQTSQNVMEICKVTVSNVFRDLPSSKPFFVELLFDVRKSNQVEELFELRKVSENFCSDLKLT